MQLAQHFAARVAKCGGAPGSRPGLSHYETLHGLKYLNFAAI
jgi:hypothetical protein